jgi:hypothetical protein
MNGDTGDSRKALANPVNATPSNSSSVRPGSRARVPSAAARVGVKLRMVCPLFLRPSIDVGSRGRLIRCEVGGTTFPMTPPQRRTEPSIVLSFWCFSICNNFNAVLYHVKSSLLLHMKLFEVYLR